MGINCVEGWYIMTIKEANNKLEKIDNDIEYWLKEKERVMINPKIADLITDCFTQVSEKGIKEVYTKQNFKKLYKKYCG